MLIFKKISPDMHGRTMALVCRNAGLVQGLKRGIRIVVVTLYVKEEMWGNIRLILHMENNIAVYIIEPVNNHI